MIKERIFSANTAEEVAEVFSEIVSRKYSEYLEFWKQTVKNDKEESYLWQLKINKEREIVKNNAYQKILKIMTEPQNRKFFKRRWYLLRSKDVISITKSGGFYKDLLPKQDIKYLMERNEEYLINRKLLFIEKKTHWSLPRKNS